MSVKVDYVNKVDTKSNNPVNANEGIDVVYLTGAGYIDYPFRGVGRDSGLGWQEAVWGGDLTRSTNFVLTNITDVKYGMVARLEITYKYMNIKDYQVLQEISRQRVCYATYYDRDTCEWVVRQEMAFTGNELGKLYAFGTEYLGNQDVKIKLVATNRDKAEATYTISFNKNNTSASGSIADYQVAWSENTSYAKACKKEGNTEFSLTGCSISYFSTNADGSGLRFLPNQEITVFKNWTLYAQWKRLPITFDSDWGTQLTNNGINIDGIESIRFDNDTTIPSDYTYSNINLTSGIKLYSKNDNYKNISFYSLGEIYAPINSSGLFFKMTSSAVHPAYSSIIFNNFNTENVTNMDSMFYTCSNITSLDLSKFNTSNVTTMRSMFSNCESLTNLDISNFDTSKVTDMYYMFSGCISLTNLDVSNFNTSEITEMTRMFNNCKLLTSLDLSRFNTKKVTHMDYMFFSCSALTDLDLSNFDLIACLSTEKMLIGCNALTILNTPYNSGNETRTITIPKQMYDSNDGYKPYSANSEYICTTISHTLVDSE